MINYWWVNHKQTHITEINGGYIWSPKTERNGARSQFYINLTLVKPGDVVFSYANARIMAIGVVTSNHCEQTKPIEFGNRGQNWTAVGWIVPIEWRKLPNPFSPKAYINDIAPLLPNGYSPITQLGNGNQKCYLAQISKDLADLLITITSKQNLAIKDQIDDLAIDIKSESKLQEIIYSDIELTEKEQLTMARIGQGVFKRRLLEIERKCRVTTITDQNYLVASHIKPWSDSNNKERLDGHNGLLLSPHVDKLFDRGWISFEDNGNLIVSNEKTRNVMTAWGLDHNMNVGVFSADQKRYLAYHREVILKKH